MFDQHFSKVYRLDLHLQTLERGIREAADTDPKRNVSAFYGGRHEEAASNFENTGKGFAKSPFLADQYRRPIRHALSDAGRPA